MPSDIFETGASRDSDQGKLDYEGFLSPVVLRTYAEFMHRNRYTPDGVRDSDNWQRGIPIIRYMKSLLRHTMEAWTFHRERRYKDGFLVNALCAIIFNAMGIIFEIKKDEDVSS